MASKRKKECHDYETSHRFRRNYVMEVVEATDTHGHTRTHADTYGHTRTHTDTHEHKRMHTDTHGHTRTHTDTH